MNKGKVCQFEELVIFLCTPSLPGPSHDVWSHYFTFLHFLVHLHFRFAQIKPATSVSETLTLSSWSNSRRYLLKFTTLIHSCMTSLSKHSNTFTHDHIRWWFFRYYNVMYELHANYSYHWSCKWRLLILHLDVLEFAILPNLFHSCKRGYFHPILPY